MQGTPDKPVKKLMHTRPMDSKRPPPSSIAVLHTHRHGLIRTLGAIAVVCLCGCSTMWQRAGDEPAAPVVTVPMAAAPASAPAEPAKSSSLPLLKVAPLPLPIAPGPGSLALHPQMPALADQLAGQFQLDPAWVTSVIARGQSSEQVARLIMPASNPGAKNWAAYRARFIEPIRIKAGLQFWRANEAHLKRAESVYGVPADIIAGIIGVETLYGRYTGQFRVLDALGTLSLDFPKGRSDRSAFFRAELGQFLRLCAEQNTDPLSVLGSFAGAIGLPQFMPSSIRRYAVDFDGDGHIDLRNSEADAIGSVAHYLAQSGWRPGVPTHYTVTPPVDDAARQKMLAPDILPTFSAPDMQSQGAVLDDLGQQHTAGPLALVLLYNGSAEPTYVAGTANFYAITRYNQSSYYALAVIELGRALTDAFKAPKS